MARQQRQQQPDVTPPPARVFWRVFRCKTCGRLQFKGYLPLGARVQIQCWHSSCKRINFFKMTEEGLEYTEDMTDEISTPADNEHGRSLDVGKRSEHGGNTRNGAKRASKSNSRTRAAATA